MPIDKRDRIVLTLARGGISFPSRSSYSRIIANDRSSLINVLLKILSLFMIQVIINLGVVTSLFPVTGITLPLLSYGGSSLVVLLFSLGLIINGGKEDEENSFS